MLQDIQADFGFDLVLDARPASGIPHVDEETRLARAPELTIVVPTFKERANIVPLLDRLDAVLAGIAWEAIFVDDDSPDGTADVVRAAARADAARGGCPS
jgi:dolichol-phosphate mannosyltransferase